MPSYPSIVYDLDDVTYHADRESLSSTGAKTILRSPAQFKWQLDHPKESEALALGGLFHALVLGQDHRFIKKDWDARTKEGKAQAEEVTALGLIPISAEDWTTAEEMAGAILANHVAADILSEGKAEVSAFGIDPVTGVKMRGRFDWERTDGVIGDLKSARNANPDAFARAAAEFRYHLQCAWYEELAAMNGQPCPHFYFLSVEKEPSFLTSVVELDADADLEGHALAAKAREIFRDCTAVDLWPEWTDYAADEVAVVSLPRWAFSAA